MGLQQTVRFRDEATPSWEAVRDQLARVGEVGHLRMIDGLPAFPDERPPDDWTELRVGTSGGMVTVRRGPGTLTCVIWGTSDDALRTAWAKLTWACAEAGGGVVELPGGAIGADEFARLAMLSPA
jgi:hypothetical protein